jgi:hypothetical protein
MKPQFILYRRNGTYYSEDTQTGKQQSLRTKDEAAAKALLHSKNEAYLQPIPNQSKNSTAGIFCLRGKIQRPARGEKRVPNP